MQIEELADKLSRIQNLYICRGFSNPADCAQDQLQGRTHYAEPFNLKFFHARILGARPLYDGLFYWILESCALDLNNSARGFRAVMFDLFGEVVYKPSFDDCKKNRSTAETAFQSWANTFDPIEHYRQAVAARADRLSRQAETLREIFETIPA